MSNDDLRAELDRMQAELRTLQASRTKETPPATEHNDLRENVQALTQTAEDALKQALDGDSQGTELMAQFKSVVHELNEDLHHTHPSTLLTMFVLGILVGRVILR
jgi:predicted component of type VI protein secretion system